MNTHASQHRQPNELPEKKGGRTWPPRAAADTWAGMTTSQAAGSTRPHTPVQVADRLDVMAAAHLALDDELDRIGAPDRRVCDATVRRLEQVLGAVRAGARARTELDGVESRLLRDGALLWTARRRRQRATAATATATDTSPGSRHLSVVDGDPGNAGVPA